MTTDRPLLRGTAVLLRYPQRQDGAVRLALGRDPGIMRMFGADAADVPPMTAAQAGQWVEDLTAHPYAWVVEHHGQCLGEVRLDGLNPHDARARLAIGLYDPAKLGMGLGREAVRLVLAHAFGPLGLNRVSLRVVAYNTRAIRCYRACGFVEEGREREAALFGGTWHDDIMMGVLAREFARNDSISGVLAVPQGQPA
jgi:RimJ/RimL family protein N-acetyltransferase